MPGYELIGKEEQAEINKIFDEGSGVLFRHSFENIRKNSFKVKDFENKFAKKMGANYALAVSSGTAALRVALAVLDLSAEDEIITQSFTFVATVEAILESGAKPVCADIDKTLNLDPNDLKNKINSKTKAVIVVHMLGTPANLIEIKKICDENNLTLIEDTAWGCGGSLKEKALGTWGRMGAFSFDFAKTITTGEGGMVVFNNESDYTKAAAWHDHGHENNPLLPRWEDSRTGRGFNFRMTELQGAVGLAQLKKLDYIVKSQNQNKKEILKLISKLDFVSPRLVPEGSNETADALVFFTPNKEIAINCREALLKVGVSTKILPEALNWHFAKKWEHIEEITSNNDDFCQSSTILEKAVSLPIFVNMEKSMPEKIFHQLQKAIDL